MGVLLLHYRALDEGVVLQVEDKNNQAEDKKVKEEDTDMKDAEADAKTKDTKSEGQDKADKGEEVKKEKTPIPMPEKPQLQLHGKLCTTGAACATSAGHCIQDTRLHRSWTRTRSALCSIYGTLELLIAPGLSRHWPIPNQVTLPLLSRSQHRQMQPLILPLQKRKE